MAITKNKSVTLKSIQEVLSDSMDDDFDVLAVELVGYHADSDSLKRISVDSNGKLKTA